MTKMKAGPVHKTTTFIENLTNLIYRNSRNPLVSQRQTPKRSRFVENGFPPILRVGPVQQMKAQVKQKQKRPNKYLEKIETSPEN